MELYKRGSTGPMVREIQKALHLMPDGIFGSMTEAAVKDFQRSVHLIADGIVGPATLVKLIPVRLRKSKRIITDIIIHCTASQPCTDLSADDIMERVDLSAVGDGEFVEVYDTEVENFNILDSNLVLFFI